MATVLLVVAAVLILIGLLVEGMAGLVAVGLIVGAVGVVLLVLARRGPPAV